MFEIYSRVGDDFCFLSPLKMEKVELVVLGDKLPITSSSKGIFLVTRGREGKEEVYLRDKSKGYISNYNKESEKKIK